MSWARKANNGTTSGDPTEDTPPTGNWESIEDTSSDDEKRLVDARISTQCCKCDIDEEVVAPRDSRTRKNVQTGKLPFRDSAVSTGGSRTDVDIREDDGKHLRENRIR